jgi:outer membrane murein-binding lipoprotein Lpp
MDEMPKEKAGQQNSYLFVNFKKGCYNWGSMTMFKSQWNTEGDNVRFSVPFSKVDVERRIVSGFATLDNVDKQADIVTSEASVKAFSKFRGNIREMHQPTAVGKMVNFKEDRYFDPESKKFYSGVYVSAYVSKGAQDTWEKVLDGTLSGFSIGGKMNKWDDAYDEKMDSQIRVIKDYDLVELSLVDNPANQFANILSIEKVDGVDVVKGIDADVELENVFWDKESNLIIVSENESEVSPLTSAPMENIGFVEKNDSEKTDMIKFLVDSAKGINTSKMTKEVSPMTDETTNLEEVVEKSEEVAPEADATESDIEKAEHYEEEKGAKDKKMEDEEDDEDKAEKADSEELAEEPVKKSEESEEVSKSDDAIAAEAVVEIKNTLTSAFSDLAETIKSLNEQVSELKKSMNGISEDVAAAKHDLQSTTEKFDEFGKRVDAVEQDTAFRKSGDLGEIVQDQPDMVEKSLWGGRFLKTADLFR